MDVIVSGGGPVGLMTAALLHAAGVRVEVYERNSQPSQRSRGTTMHPRTLEVLTTLRNADGQRVSDVLLAQGKPVPSTHYATLPNLVDYRGLDTPYPFVLMLPQWCTEHALADHLRSRGVAVHYGAEVTEIEQSADGVRVRANDNWHTARYVIGADGAHSVVRHAAGIDFPGTAPDMMGFVADVRLPEPVQRAQHHWNAAAGNASVVPLTDTITRIFGVQAADTGLTPEQARRRQAEPLTLDELRAALIRICGTDFDVLDATWLSRSGNSSRHVTHYRAGRVLLTGDAAHVHLPAGGQGLNVGLQDATNLAWKLAAEVHGWAPDRLITGADSYDAERRPVAEKLVASTRAQDALMHTFSPAGQALRDLFGDLIARGGEVTEELAGGLSGLALAYPRPADAHPLVGTRAPDLPLATGTLLRAVRPDRFLLLDLTADHALAGFGSSRVDVHPAPRPTDPRRAAWSGVQAALIRPDGYLAHATESVTTPAAAAALRAAIAAWTESDHGPETDHGLDTERVPETGSEPVTARGL